MLTLSDQDLLTIEQIESVIFPHTHLYIVTLPPHIRRSSLLGNITLSYTNNRRVLKKEQTIKKENYFYIHRETI